MKHYSLRYVALGLFCALVVSTSVHGSSEPTPVPLANATWKQSLKTSGKHELSNALFFLKYIKLPSIALNYANPAWKVSRFFNLFGNTEHAVTGLAVGYALNAISLRYKKQIVESCGDEETADAWMAVAPFAAFLLPYKVSCLAALALVTALQKKEWNSKKKSQQFNPVVRLG
jgi:hypothetical protein